CHRLAANQFDAFAKAVRPKILLGLTATPERSDGQPIALTLTHGQMAAPQWKCGCGTRWIFSCWLHLSTMLATMRPISRT
ncbi:MAG: hypothetical protein WEK74_09105, partial [Hydrogenophaga sp.]